MAANLREEIRRLQRRKQIHYAHSNSERMQDTSSEGSNSGSEQGPESPSRSDKALFTFKQVFFLDTVLYNFSLTLYTILKFT